LFESTVFILLLFYIWLINNCSSLSLFKSKESELRDKDYDADADADADVDEDNESLKKPSMKYAIEENSSGEIEMTRCDSLLTKQTALLGLKELTIDSSCNQVV
jgi:hypothetical protein